MRLEREDRQIESLACCRRVGDGDAANVVARVRAIAAEAVALAGSAGMACADLHALVEQARQAPVREPCDLVGGLSVALLAFCEARGLSADHCERNELARVLSLSPMSIRGQDFRYGSKGGAR
jgi:uncharacterized membrane protein